MPRTAAAVARLAAAARLSGVAAGEGEDLGDDVGAPDGNGQGGQGRRGTGGSGEKGESCDPSFEEQFGVGLLLQQYQKLASAMDLRGKEGGGRGGEEGLRTSPGRLQGGQGGGVGGGVGGRRRQNILNWG